MQVSEPVGRSAGQIVQQTNELALLLMREVYQREPAEGSAPTLRDSRDPRGQFCWKLACQIQEMLTNTDPENALAELDDEPAAVQVQVSPAEQWREKFMPDAAPELALAAYAAAQSHDGA